MIKFSRENLDTILSNMTVRSRLGRGQSEETKAVVSMIQQIEATEGACQTISTQGWQSSNINSMLSKIRKLIKQLGCTNVVSHKGETNEDGRVSTYIAVSNPTQTQLDLLIKFGKVRKSSWIQELPPHID